MKNIKKNNMQQKQGVKTATINKPLFFAVYAGGALQRVKLVLFFTYCLYKIGGIRGGKMPNKAVCSIEYVERINKLVNIKFTVEEFILSDSVRERGVALAIIQNTLAHEQLKKKNLPGYVRIRTCALESYEPCSDVVDDPELVALTDKAVAMDCVPQTIGNYDGELVKHKLRKAIDDKHDSIERDKKRRGRPRAGEAYELAG